jgi:hypothetical protein
MQPFAVGVIVWLAFIWVGVRIRSRGRQLTPRAYGRQGRDYRQVWLGNMVLLGAGLVAVTFISYMVLLSSAMHGP